ncbi:MAG: hypothetical protein ACREJN_04795 [Nitrospiraceae bacterium]
MTKPRPKTLTDADMKLLKELLIKPTWFSFEQRIVHDIWAEVSGKNGLILTEQHLPGIRHHPSPHYSRGFVTKPPRRQARRARGAAREGGILETVAS